MGKGKGGKGFWLQVERIRKRENREKMMSLCTMNVEVHFAFSYFYFEYLVNVKQCLKQVVQPLTIVRLCSFTIYLYSTTCSLPGTVVDLIR